MAVVMVRYAVSLPEKIENGSIKKFEMGEVRHMPAFRNAEGFCVGNRNRQPRERMGRKRQIFVAPNDHGGDAHPREVGSQVFGAVRKADDARVKAFEVHGHLALRLSRKGEQPVPVADFDRGFHPAMRRILKEYTT